MSVGTILPENVSVWNRPKKHCIIISVMANPSVSSQILGSQGAIDFPQYKTTSPIVFQQWGGGIDLTAYQQNTKQFIEAALSMYVDNGNNPAALTLTFASGQIIVVPANTQGYFNILQQNPVRFTASGYTAGAYCMLLNRFMPAMTWPSTQL